MTESSRSVARPTDGENARLLKLGVRLVVATMAYNLVEAGVALWSGIAAGSIALVGFGFDAVIEFAAASLLLWRLRVESNGADHETIERTEGRVLRFVGATFILLALYVLIEAGTTLWFAEAPSESTIGLILAATSLTVMPIIAFQKLRVADRLGSRSLRAEAKETLACSILSLTLLVGLALNAWLGWWWADPVAALAMVPWLVKEGMEGLRGEHCDDDDGCEHGAGRDDGGCGHAACEDDDVDEKGTSDGDSYAGRSEASQDSPGGLVSGSAA